MVMAAPVPSDAIAAIPAVVDRLHGDQLLIPITAEGRRFACAVDSGGGDLVSLDERAGALVGLFGDTAGVSAGIGATLVRDQRLHGITLEIGGLTFENQTIVLRQFAADTAGIDCYLGLGVLRAYVVEFDYVIPR